ncbi:MAG: hypothetical protein EXS10_04705 [Phycisphaerales bacterium]|nr:hypothetical protein [Phycisphaerales bacterium]
MNLQWMQTSALFVDAYRELNARKLFWIALVLNALVVAVIGALGIDEKGVTVLVWHLEMTGVNSAIFPPDQFYHTLFASFGVGFWLAWISTILALLSTATIFPELVTGGVDTLVSKPISRHRLYFTKFATGLLFTLAQVLVFTTLSFLVLGIRGGVWSFGLFIAVPIMLVFYSYLYSVMAVMGSLTRSVIASVIVTLLFWVGIWAVHAGEQFTLLGETVQNVEITAIERRLENAQTVVGRAPLEADLANAQVALGVWRPIHLSLYALKTALPKASETIQLLNRSLKQIADVPTPDDDEMNDSAVAGRGFLGSKYARRRDVQAAIERDMKTRPLWWVLGTSLAFEAALLGFGAWRFSRRDF